MGLVGITLVGVECLSPNYPVLFAARSLRIAGVSVTSFLNALLIGVGPVFVVQGIIKGLIVLFT